MNAQLCACAVIGLAASIEDLALRRISNWISATAFAAGVAIQSVANGWTGALSAVGGCAAGFAVFLLFYILGGMGGGDVKLMAGFGALLGAARLLQAALWTAAIGGIMAAAYLLVAYLRARMRHDTSSAAPRAIPYAPAIAVGALLSLVPQG